MIDYNVVLDGVDAFDLPASVLAAVCELIVEGSRRAVRLVGEGRSVAPGTPPAWVANAAEVRITRFASGSLDLGVRAPRLSDVHADLFGPSLFPLLPDPDATAFDLLMGAISDAGADVKGSDLLDPGVLETLARASSLFARGGTALRLDRPGSKTVELTSATTARAQRLIEETPSPRVARVSANLDALTVSSRGVMLKLEGHRVLRGVASAVALEDLKAQLGNDVVVEGEVTFRPSGDPLRIVIDHVRPAGPGDVIWAKQPRPEARNTRGSVTSPNDLDRLFGQWPGEESDDELVQALRAVS